MFSSRLPSALEPNALSLEIARLRASGAPLIDLTETNPTRVGLPYPPSILGNLADPRGLVYEPSPFGLRDAREAVAREFARQGRPIAADRIVLTASTSDAYTLLFKLLCNADDEVLVPRPSYPLFDLLTRLDNVTAVPYLLEYHGVWSIDRASFDHALTPRTRAVLVVSPNNPTGSMLRKGDLEWLSARCVDHALALIGDEVFADYPLARRDDACVVTDQARALTFSLGGLSKSAGLPQLKLGWIAVTGPDPLAADALARLEVIADTYLSVGTPVQVAAARLIEAGATVRAALSDRLQRNLRALRSALDTATCVSLLEPEGGWCAVLQVPAIHSEDALVLRLATEAHVIVHPGYFFDFSREAFLVVSLVPEPAVFDEGVARLLALVSAESR
jgi:aspartate/methionine/tyrosine aminotransferase